MSRVRVTSSCDCYALLQQQQDSRCQQWYWFASSYYAEAFNVRSLCHYSFFSSSSEHWHGRRSESKTDQSCHLCKEPI